MAVAATACSTSGRVCVDVFLGSDPAPDGTVVFLEGPNARQEPARVGVACFDGLDAGSYRVSASVPSTLEGSVDVAAAVALKSDERVELRFTPVASVFGRVLLESEPAAGVLVAVLGQHAVTTTAEDGSYVLRSVPTGERRVVASHPGYRSALSAPVDVRYKTPATVNDLVLVPGEPGGLASISGSVQVNGAGPLPGEGEAAPVITYVGPMIGTERPDPDGSFRIASLLPGEYTVRIEVPHSVESAWARTITLGAVDEVDVGEVVFTGAGVIRGEVRVPHRETAGGVLIAVDGSTAIVTGADGKFAIRGVGVGPRSVALSCQSCRARSLSIDVAYAAERDIGLIEMEPATVLNGVAKLFGRDDHSGTEVRVIPDDSVPALTGANGAFAFGGVSTGLFTLALENGPYTETVPGLLVFPDGSGYILTDGRIHPLPELLLPRARRLLSAEVTDPPRASPDGRLLLVRDTGSRLYLVSTETAEAVQIDGNASRYVFESAAFPPGGDVVYYVANLTQTGGVLRAVSAQGEELFTAGQGVDPSFLALSPDGKTLLFTELIEPMSTYRRLQSLATATRQVTTLASNASGYGGFDFSPDGKTITYVRADSQTLISRRVDNGAETILSTWVYEPRSWKYSASSTHIGFPRDFGAELRVVNLGNGQKADFPRLDMVSSFAFSPDGSKVTMVTPTTTNTKRLITAQTTGPIMREVDVVGVRSTAFLASGEGVVMRVWPSGELPRLVTWPSSPTNGAVRTLQDDVSDFVLAPGGSWSAATIETSTGPQLVRVELTGSKQVLFHGDADRLEIASDRRHIAFLTGSNRSAFVVPAAGGDPIPVHPRIASGVPFWIPGNSLIALVRSDPGPLEFRRGVYVSRLAEP